MVLDVWCELSVFFRSHIIDAVHSHERNRYALVLEVVDVDSANSAEMRSAHGDQFVLGPLCAECLPVVAEVVAFWTLTNPGFVVTVRPWCDVAVLRRGRWGAM